MENKKLLAPKVSLTTATGPGCSSTVVMLVSDTSTSKDTVAVDDLLDVGTYPIFLARETMFSLNVALSMNTSLDSIFALYDAIYVLYASVSIIVERFDPSKS